MQSGRNEQWSCHPIVNFLSVCGARGNDFLHLPDNSMTTAIRELPNLTPWKSWQQAIESNGPGCITDSGGRSNMPRHISSLIRRSISSGLILLAGLLGLAGCGSYSPPSQPPPTPTSTTVSPTSASVVAGTGTQNFTATVMNDYLNKRGTWTLPRLPLRRLRLLQLRRCRSR